MTDHCNKDKTDSRSAQRHHRITRTGRPKQDKQDRTYWTGCSAKTSREIIKGSQKFEENEYQDFNLALCVWIELLRQNRPRVTDRTEDWTDSKG
jgi:hypothetical protein